MAKNRFKISTLSKNIEYKMLRENENCFIKIEPIARVSNPSTLYISLNNEIHRWEIYDKNGTEANIVYFKGCNCKPRFYLKTGYNMFEVLFNTEKIYIKSILKKHKIENYIKKNCDCKSKDASCWATAIFYSKRPDKPPFDEL